MLGGIGIPELLLIFFIVLLFFGARRLPEIGGTLDKGIREFKDSLKGVGDDVRGELEGSRDGEESDVDDRSGGRDTG